MTIFYLQAEIHLLGPQTVPLLGEHFLYRPAAQQLPDPQLPGLPGEEPRAGPVLAAAAAGGGP